MRQRLGIAVALIHDPDLIILDEPMNGLDPQGIADIRNLILHLSKDLKKTVFVSSHLLSEMELIADHMLIIDKGKKIVEGKVSELLNPEETNVELETLNPQNSVTQIKKSLWASHFENMDGEKIILKMHSDQIPQFIRDVSQMNIAATSIRKKHSLEDYFLSLTAHHDGSATAN